MKAAQKFIDIPFTVVTSKDASGELVIEGYANTSTKDRVGDVVLPQAFEKSLKTYLDNPVLLENHNWEKVAGSTKSAEITDKGLFIRARISDTRPDLKTQIREGCLRTFSIGYNELDADFDESTKTKIVKDLELLEISIVSVPANPEAKFHEVTGGAEAQPDAKAAAPANAGAEGVAIEQEPVKPMRFNDIGEPLCPNCGKAMKKEDEQYKCAACAQKALQVKADALQSCVSDSIPRLMNEGYEQEQAIAIAFHECGEKSVAAESTKIERHAGESMESCVARGIATLINEGKDKDQAAAIAFSMCGEKSTTSGKDCCKECEQKKKAKKNIGKTLSFIETVKIALEVDVLDKATVLAICEYTNANEEIMTKKELIELLKKKAATKADAPAADPSKPAPAAEPAKPASDDIGKMLSAVMEKLDQLAQAMATLLEDESQEESQEGDEPAADASKGDMACKECGEPMTKGADGQMSCKNGHKADSAAEPEAEKAVEELEKTIADLEKEISEVEKS